MDKKKYSNQGGFTLVELIVVIVILAILATIAFLSFNSYSGTARDSDRMADINNFSKSLELYQVKVGSYPSPDNSFTLTYSGGAVWYQGTLGDTLTRKLGILSKKVVDPLTSNEYTYSQLAFGSAYQIKANYEGDSLSFENGKYKIENSGIDNSIPHLTSPKTEEELSLITRTNLTNKNEELSLPLDKGELEGVFGFNGVSASTGNPKIAYIKGNYLGTVAKTTTGTTIYILALPSIITSTGTSGNSYEISANVLSGYLLYNGQSNTTGINYNPATKIVFSGTSLPTNDTNSGITNIVNNIISAYSGTIVTSISSNIQTIVNTPTSNLATLGAGIISTQLGGSASVASGGLGGTTSIYFPGEDGISGTSDDCNTPNITLTGGQVWSACNLGAKTAFNTSNGGAYNADASSTRGGDDNVNGKLYQWGRNKGFSSSDTTQSAYFTSNPNGNDTTQGFVWNASLTDYDWLTPHIDTIWGGSTSDSATVDGQTNDALRQGPCPSGWHIPSAKDWQDACNSIMSPTVCSNAMADATGKVRTALLLPYAGFRFRNNGLYYRQGTHGFYWSSSPSTTNAFGLGFVSANVRPTNAYYRANGFTVRCLKN